MLRFVWLLFHLFMAFWQMSCETCNIPIIPISHLSSDGINYNMLPEFPLIYRGDDRRQESMAREGSFESLYYNHGDVITDLSSSNTYSHGRRKMKLSDYLDSLNPVQVNGTKANETYYLFGHNYEGIWSQLRDLYVTPPCKFCEEAGAVTVGIGGPRSGVSFHFHGPGFSEVIIGAKKWYLFPSSLTKVVEKFGANTTMSHWSEVIYQQLKNPNSELDTNVDGVTQQGLSSIPNGFTVKEWYDLSSNLHECTIFPGDILYFPSQWMHATLNTEDYNLFVSVFIDPQLIRKS